MTRLAVLLLLLVAALDGPPREGVSDGCGSGALEDDAAELAGALGAEASLGLRGAEVEAPTLAAVMPAEEAEPEAALPAPSDGVMRAGPGPALEDRDGGLSPIDDAAAAARVDDDEDDEEGPACAVEGA